MSDKQYKPPAYLVRAIRARQQEVATAQAGLQSAYNTAGEWMVDETGLTIEQVVTQFDFDGEVFKPRQSAVKPATQDDKPERSEGDGLPTAA